MLTLTTLLAALMLGANAQGTLPTTSVTTCGYFYDTGESPLLSVVSKEEEETKTKKAFRGTFSAVFHW
jgi:hypothetical protein